jgi:hypothetical protein
MASITFEILDATDISGSGVSGSGLGFYGSGGFGTSVPLFEYQKTTFLTDSAGQNNGGEVRNIEYMTGVLPYSGCRLNNTAGNTGVLQYLHNTEATLLIHFNHDTKVKVQNAQLRIWDRTSIDNPASGVNTKIAEIVNFGGLDYSTWLGSLPVGDFSASVIGSGDCFWWGAPWPNGSVYGDLTGATRPYYMNSVGTSFPNYTVAMSDAGSGNPDSRLSSVTFPGKETVGGTGLIVPLLDSPCSGGRGLTTGNLYPKFFQYVNTTYQSTLGVGSPVDCTGASNKPYTYGGTSGDLRHTWRLAISSAPLSIGAKQYSMYVSLEYY